MGAIDFPRIEQVVFSSLHVSDRLCFPQGVHGVFIPRVVRVLFLTSGGMLCSFHEFFLSRMRIKGLGTLGAVLRLLLDRMACGA